MINIIRKQVYEACASAGINVYDFWKTNAVYPYIIIAEVAADDTYYKLNSRTDFAFNIHVFDKSQGKLNAVNYTTTIKNSLKAIDGVNMRTSSRIFSDVEPSVIHSVLTLQLSKYI